MQVRDRYRASHQHKEKAKNLVAAAMGNTCRETSLLWRSLRTQAGVPLIIFPLIKDTMSNTGHLKFGSQPNIRYSTDRKM